MIVIHILYTLCRLPRLLMPVTYMLKQCFCTLFFKFQWSKSTKNHTRIDLNISHKILLNLSTNSFGSLINNFNSQFHAKLSTFADMHIHMFMRVCIHMSKSK